MYESGHVKDFIAVLTNATGTLTSETLSRKNKKIHRKWHNLKREATVYNTGVMLNCTGLIYTLSFGFKCLMLLFTSKLLWLLTCKMYFKEEKDIFEVCILNK